MKMDMQIYRYMDQSFLTSELIGSVQSALRLSRFMSGERTLDGEVMSVETQSAIRNGKFSLEIVITEISIKYVLRRSDCTSFPGPKGTAYCIALSSWTVAVPTESVCFPARLVSWLLRNNAYSIALIVDWNRLIERAEMERNFIIIIIIIIII
jgi:hypothetical protein